MPVITLTTEWKPDDIYYGIIRGKLCSFCPGITIVDNATGIPPLDIAHASFVIRNTYSNYPEGTIHIICIHSEAHKEEDHVIVKARGHFFIGTDNGIFNLVLNSEPDEAYIINRGESDNELDVFVKAAAGLAGGLKPEDLGRPLSRISERFPLRATIDRDVIIGSIIFIDSYGNAISNITRELFLRVFESREFRILVQSNKNYTDKLSLKYSDVPVGEMLARFNSLDLLELSINGADISGLLNLETGSVVRVDSLEKSAPGGRLF